MNLLIYNLKIVFTNYSLLSYVLHWIKMKKNFQLKKIYFMIKLKKPFLICLLVSVLNNFLKIFYYCKIIIKIFQLLHNLIEICNFKVKINWLITKVLNSIDYLIWLTELSFKLMLMKCCNKFRKKLIRKF